MKILLTSLGHLGGAVVKALSDANELRVLCRTEKDVPAETVIGDIRSYESVQKAAQGVDAIVHTAALWHRHIQSHTYKDFYDTNATGTFNVLEAAVAQGVPKVVFASTIGVYEQLISMAWGGICGSTAVRIDETWPIKAADIYAATKIIGETLCEYYSRDKGLETICLRFGAFFLGEGTAEYAARFHRGWLVDVNEDVNTTHEPPFLLPN